MKKLLILFIGLILLASCHNYKQDAERLTMQRDSLNIESAMKDSSIIAYLSDLNEIMTTLDSIKTLEKLVTVKSAERREMSYSQKKKIIEDINLLNDMLQKNKEQIASLQKKLNNANYKVGKLNALVAELEQMANNLQKQVEDKNTEIARLSKDVENLTRDIHQLNEKIAVIEDESQQKSNTIEKQTLEMNKAYFVVGSGKELKDGGIIDRSGGFLGIGKTATMREDFDKDLFTEVDKRKLQLIPLNVKKVEVVSVHPAGSFHISGEKTADTLFIDNKAEFWSVSKYLVVIAQ